MPAIIDPMENRAIKRYFLQGKEEGMQKGRVEGEQEGARKEAMSLLTRQLERRFGPLSKAVLRKLKAADLVTLEAWSLRVLDAGSLEAVIAMEDRNQILAAQTGDFREGIVAFLQKRPPSFGRLGDSPG